MALDILKYNEDIRAKIDQIETERDEDPKRIYVVAKELMDYAFEANETDLYAYALFNKGYCEYMSGETNNAMTSFANVQLLLEQTGQWVLYARSYAILGTIYSSVGNMSMAMDKYVKGRAICTEYHIDNVKIFIDCNIGGLHMSFYNYPEAMQSFKDAIEATKALNEKDGQVPLSDEQIASIYLNWSCCYVQEDEPEKAREYLNYAKNYGKDASDESLMMAFDMLEAQICYIERDEKHLDEIVKKIDKKGMSFQGILNAFDDILAYITFLRQIGRDEEFIRALHQTEDHIKVTDSTYFQIRLLEQKIAYYKAKGLKSEYFLATAEHYELSMKRNFQKMQSYGQSLTDRLNLEDERAKRMQAQQEKESYKTKAETDSLTGINNRAKINELSETKFNEAIEKKMSYAIEMIDIDFFKEYNDTYGHQAGDEVIKSVANALASLQRHYGVYVGRYGGDEFTMVMIDKEYSEVCAITQELHDKMHANNITHKASKVTDRVSISQGAYFGYPTESSKLWDFLSSADKALYKVKEAGKNGLKVDKD